MVSRFYDYPYTTHISDLQAPTMDIDDVQAYLSPDLTVCNVDPFKLQPGDNTVFSEFKERIASYKAAGHIPLGFLEYLESPHGLLQYIGPDRAKEISHRKDMLVQHCNILFLGPTGIQTSPCYLDKNIKLTFLPSFFSCYTISYDAERFMSLTLEGKMVLGVDLILYLDNDLELIDLPFHKEDFRGLAGGAMIGKKVVQSQNGFSQIEGL